MITLGSFIAADGTTVALNRISPADEGFHPTRPYVICYDCGSSGAVTYYEEFLTALAQFNRLVDYHAAPDAGRSRAENGSEDFPPH